MVPNSLSHRFQRTADIGVGEHDRRLSLQGLEVAAREPVPFFRRREQLFDLIGERRRIDAQSDRLPGPTASSIRTISPDSACSHANQGSLITSCSRLPTDPTRPRSISYAARASSSSTLCRCRSLPRSSIELAAQVAFSVDAEAPVAEVSEVTSGADARAPAPRREGERG